MIARGGTLWIDDDPAPLDLENFTPSHAAHPKNPRDEDGVLRSRTNSRSTIVAEFSPVMASSYSRPAIRDDEEFWTEHASELADAYCRSAGTVRFELVTRALLKHLPPAPQRIVDVGGGFGRQAIMLARAGHSVVIVDPDPNMLAIARDALSIEPPEVVERVMLVSGDGATAEKLVGTDFDMACCHSVLMYQDDPVPLLRSVTALVRKNG